MAGLNSVGFSIGENEVDLDSLRACLRKMTDAELARDIQLGEKFCSPQVNFGRPPRQVFVIQLAEARSRARAPKRKGTQEMTWRGGRTNANRAHHSHNPHNHLGPTYLVE